MPFESEAQRRYMYANHPDIAAKWSAEYPNQGPLPEHVAQKATKKKHKRQVGHYTTNSHRRHG